MQAQAGHLRGAHGAVLQVLDKTDGKLLTRRELSGLPAFDGLIAAVGRLYLVAAEGGVVCWAQGR